MILTKYFWALFAKILNYIVPVKSGYWVFASDKGNLYREGAKYLFEYVNRVHPEIHCTYIVRKRETLLEIRSKGYRAYMNDSIKGIFEVIRAQAVFTTTDINDMKYAYNKKGRKRYYLNHGQCLKKQMKALSNNYLLASNQIGVRFSGFLSPLNSIYSAICNFLFHYATLDDSSFVSANSEYFIPFFKACYGEDMRIKVLGMPRNDSLFNKAEMESEKWLPELNGKFVITYMPTHRMYGVGSLTPIPFVENKEILAWMEKNNVVLLMKQHPNMIREGVNHIHTNTIVDITKMRLDPQVIIYHSDVLISDYSSVWLDYLLLRRPLITYLYDDFEKNDAGLNIDIKNDTPGHLAFDEAELFSIIKRIFCNYNEMCPSEEQIKKFYKDIDGNACQRYFDAVTNDLKEYE